MKAHKIKKVFITVTLTTALLLPVPAQSVMAANTQSSQTAVTDYSAVFNANYYYQVYPDLQQSIGNDPAALLNHFITIGMKEGRNGSASFQVKAYMYNNPDLIATYGIKDLSSYYIHYITCGKAEGRIATFKEGQEFSEGTLGCYSTTYDTTEDRAVNVELSAARINGMVIQPGETFSYSKSVGTRTLANGYVVAPSYASGRVVSSVGGGICQVSSTLYVTMLLSGIPATQHYLHSLPVEYVPRGLDAAIVEGYKDLTFKNNFDFPITINTTTENGVLTVSIVKA